MRVDKVETTTSDTTHRKAIELISSYNMERRDGIDSAAILK